MLKVADFGLAREMDEKYYRIASNVSARTHCCEGVLLTGTLSEFKIAGFCGPDVSADGYKSCDPCCRVCI